MLRGEKTAVFWLGLVVLGYSIYEFCSAGWFIFAYKMIEPSISYELYPTVLNTIVPPIIGGIVFLVIGLYVMKVGVKKSSLQT